MEFTFLPDRLREQFAEIYRREFKTEPNFNVMSAVVGVQDGFIKGFMCVYATPVIDSMWIDPSLRRTGLLRRLLDGIKALPWARSPLFVGISRREKAAGRRFGEELDWKVFKFHG